MNILSTPELIANLGSDDALTRQHARLILVHQGEKNIPALTDALESENSFARREATRALGNFHTPEVADALTQKLMDEDFSVRWIAMESLLKFGRSSLRPVLELFAKHFDLVWVREGVHHILRVLKDRHDLNDVELRLFTVLDQQAHTNFSTGWTGEEAWAAEKVLEILDREAA